MMLHHVRSLELTVLVPWLIWCEGQVDIWALQFTTKFSKLLWS